MAGYLKALKSAVVGSEPAPYEVVAKNKDFEERSYPAMKWVCTKRKAKHRADIQKDMFMTLFAYINGKNESNAKIEMTVPVTVHYVHCEEEPAKEEEKKQNGEAEEGEKKEGGEGEKKEEEKKEGEEKKEKEKVDDAKMKEFTMGFYIPKIFQENPPKPTDANVFIEERPAMTIITRTFGGYAKESQWETEKKQLEELAKSFEGLSLDTENFYTAGYDPPFKPLLRRNELWLLVTGGTTHTGDGDAKAEENSKEPAKVEEAEKVEA